MRAMWSLVIWREGGKVDGDWGYNEDLVETRSSCHRDRREGRTEDGDIGNICKMM